MVDHELSFTWTCTICDNLNHSHINTSTPPISTDNSFSILSDANVCPSQTSYNTPKPKTKNEFMSKIKIICVNCQSIIYKKWTAKSNSASKSWCCYYHRSTDCEILWVKLEVKGFKPFYIAPYYKPHENDTKSILELEKSLHKILMAPK